MGLNGTRMNQIYINKKKANWMPKMKLISMKKLSKI